MSRHTKPYRCSTCGMGFGAARDRKRHEQTHTPTKLYRCGFPQCDFVCTRKDSCVRHIKGKHVVEVDVDEMAAAEHEKGLTDGIELN